MRLMSYLHRSSHIHRSLFAAGLRTTVLAVSPIRCSTWTDWIGGLFIASLVFPTIWYFSLFNQREKLGRYFEILGHGSAQKAVFNAFAAYNSRSKHSSRHANGFELVSYQ